MFIAEAEKIGAVTNLLKDGQVRESEAVISGIPKITPELIMGFDDDFRQKQFQFIILKLAEEKSKAQNAAVDKLEKANDKMRSISIADSFKHDAQEKLDEV